MKKIIFILAAVLTAAANSAGWTTSEEKDEMSGEISAYALSGTVKSTKPMPFPYSGVTSNIGYGCSATNEWLYLHFSASPNITRDEIEDGYNVINTRVRYDDNSPSHTTFFQDWGSKFLHFSDDRPNVRKIMSSNQLLVELNWYSSGRVYFQYPLAGSTKAINAVRKKCGFLGK